MGSFGPHRHANSNNPIICVGAINQQGLPSGFDARIAPNPSARGRDGRLIGERSIRAMGEGVIVIEVGARDG